jgi:hypothetical protein
MDISDFIKGYRIQYDATIKGPAVSETPMFLNPSAIRTITLNLSLSSQTNVHIYTVGLLGSDTSYDIQSRELDLYFRPEKQ